MHALRCFTAAFLCCLGVSLPLEAADWPQFLGPHRNGISEETGLLKSWPAAGPKEVWRVKAGVGMSGVSIVGNRVLMLYQSGGNQKALCLDAANGKTLWDTPIGPEYENGQGDGPRATPTIDGDAVYVYGGEGMLAALTLADGKIRWQHDVPKELGVKPAEYGMASSPLVAGDLVLVQVGGPGATVVAYDKQGKLSWKSGSDSAGYSSPILAKLGGREQVVVFSGKAALGLVPTDGRMLWRYPYATEYDCNTASPVALGADQVLISAGEQHGSTLLALKPEGDAFKVSEAWKSLGAESSLRSEWQTAVALNGHLYGLDNVGSAGPVTHLTCIEAATGKRVWQEQRFGKANLIAADGKLFLSTMKGELVVVKASPKAYEELGRKVVIGKTRNAPSLAGGRIYLRDDKEIVALDVSEGK